jgi:hypothetical protein
MPAEGLNPGDKEFRRELFRRGKSVEGHEQGEFMLEGWGPSDQSMSA